MVRDFKNVLNDTVEKAIEENRRQSDCLSVNIFLNSDSTCVEVHLRYNGQYIREGMYFPNMQSALNLIKPIAPDVINLIDGDGCQFNLNLLD